MADYGAGSQSPREDYTWHGNVPQPGQYPQQQGGYGGYPDAQQPVTSQPYSGPPVSAPGGGYAQPQPPPAAPTPPNKNRTLLFSLIGFCVLMVIASAITAYVGFFRGPSQPPEEVVAEYMGSAVSGDFAGAREYACDDADHGVTFTSDDESSEMVDGRAQMYQNLTWELVEVETDGDTATVVHDWKFDAAEIDGMPEGSLAAHQQRYFTLEVEDGAWMLCEAVAYPIIEEGHFDIGDCFDYEDHQRPVLECSSVATEMYTVVEFTNERDQCPGDEDPVMVTTDDKFVCATEEGE